VRSWRFIGYALVAWIIVALAAWAIVKLEMH
jgi:hypothetical protein